MKVPLFSAYAPSPASLAATLTQLARQPLEPPAPEPAAEEASLAFYDPDPAWAPEGYDDDTDY